MNDIENIIIEKIVTNDNINNIINQTLNNKELSDAIIKRVLIEKYIKGLEKEFNIKINYYIQLMIEITEQIKSSLILGYTKETIYNLIIKNDEKVEAISFHYNIYIKKNDNLLNHLQIHKKAYNLVNFY